MSLTVRKLDANHDITHAMLTGDAAIEQTVGCAIRFILGEWFLDVSEGIPWIPQPNAPGVTPILGSFPANLAYGETLLKAAILAVDGVSAITRFTFDFNHTTRAAACTATVVTVNGGTFTVNASVP